MHGQQPATEGNSDMLTAEEASKRLRISGKTLYKLIQGGEIAAAKVGRGRYGGRYRISETALDDYLKRQTIQAGTQAS
jgi:excisionase family DNA binding protein